MKKIKYKTLSFGFIIILFSTTSFLYNGCSCKTYGEDSQIPLNIFKKADSFIISKTGDEFFKKYITTDFIKSKHITPNYLMVYRFCMPEKPFINEEIRFTVDSAGSILKKYEVVGIPVCNTNPNNCDFVVDEKIAKQIATQNGLAKGIKDWKIDFEWESTYSKYVWIILSTNRENKGEFGYRGEGEKIIIDPNDASVLNKDTWKIN